MSMYKNGYSIGKFCLKKLTITRSDSFVLYGIEANVWAVQRAYVTVGQTFGGQNAINWSPVYNSLPPSPGKRNQFKTFCHVPPSNKKNSDCPEFSRIRLYIVIIHQHGPGQRTFTIIDNCIFEFITFPKSGPTKIRRRLVSQAVIYVIVTPCQSDIDRPRQTRHPSQTDIVRFQQHRQHDPTGCFFGIVQLYR